MCCDHWHGGKAIYWFSSFTLNISLSIIYSKKQPITALSVCIYICYFVDHHSSCLSPQTLLLSSWLFSVILFPLQSGPRRWGPLWFLFLFVSELNNGSAQLRRDRIRQLWELNILIIIPSTYFCIFAPQSSLGSWSSGNSSVFCFTSLSCRRLQSLQNPENTSKPVMSSLFLVERNIITSPSNMVTIHRSLSSVRPCQYHI